MGPPGLELGALTLPILALATVVTLLPWSPFTPPIQV